MSTAGPALTSPCSRARRSNARIVGVDLSRAMLAQARERATANGCKNVSLIEAAGDDAELGVRRRSAVLLIHDGLQSPRAMAKLAAPPGRGRPGRERRRKARRVLERHHQLLRPLRRAPLHDHLPRPGPPPARAGALCRRDTPPRPR